MSKDSWSALNLKCKCASGHFIVLLADFQNTKELFAGVDAPVKKPVAEDSNSILTTLEPKDEKDFLKLAAAIATRTKKYSEHEKFPLFVKELNKLLSENLDSSDVNDIVKSLNIISNEKLRAEKGNKKGKKRSCQKEKRQR